MSKFEELEQCVTKKLKEEKEKLEKYRSNHDSLDPVFQQSYGKCLDRMSNLEETTAIFLAKLTNQYMHAIQNKCSNEINCILKIFNKFGFDIKKYDEIIDKMPFKISDRTWPSVIQARILDDVFKFFECPIQLPWVGDILESASKFGVTFGKKDKNDFEIDGIEILNFSNLYNTCEYFETALKNGLSVSEIIDMELDICYAKQFYNAPRCPFRSIMGVEYNVASIVPFLKHELEEMSENRAPEIYEIAKRMFGNKYPGLVKPPVSK